jgi:hypothetical protein
VVEWIKKKVRRQLADTCCITTAECKYGVVVGAHGHISHGEYATSQVVDITRAYVRWEARCYSRFGWVRR